jgi:hypothetical protein
MNLVFSGGTPSLSVQAVGFRLLLMLLRVLLYAAGAASGLSVTAADRSAG